MADEKRAHARIGTSLARLLGLIAVAALFAVLEPATFLSVYNCKTIAAQTVIVGPRRDRDDVRHRRGRHRPVGRLGDRVVVSGHGARLRDGWNPATRGPGRRGGRTGDWHCNGIVDRRG